MPRFIHELIPGLLALGGLLSGPAIASADSCPPADGVAVQVLGSGGPIADDDRASSGYLVWVDGKARAMIDAGNGSLLRFAEA
ncbi:MAG: MBL fold metallo-hydrolase, partial [Pseudomonadota bacterium]